MEWGITLDDPDWGVGIHTLCMIVEARPLSLDDIEHLSGRLVWDETVVELCTIHVRDVGQDYVHVGDIFQTIEGCFPGDTAMQDAFDLHGVPEIACVTVRFGGVDHEYCAPLR